MASVLQGKDSKNVRRDNVSVVFKNLCPNCERDITSERLCKASVCDQCLAEPLTLKQHAKALKQLSVKPKKGLFFKLLNIERELDVFKTLFKTFYTGMWSLQEVWAKRLLLKQNFAITAPTGVGKTSFLTIASLYLALKNNSCYYILPSSIMVDMVKNNLLKFQQMVANKGFEEFSNVKVLAYHSLMKQSEKKAFFEALQQCKNNGFKSCIILTTDKFVMKHYESFTKFDYVFVDDVDSLVKAGKIINAIIHLIGAGQEVLTLAKKSLKQSLSIEEEQRFSELKTCLGRVVLSSATAFRTENVKTKVLAKVLDFTFNYNPLFLRNIEDIYKIIEDGTQDLLVKSCIDIIKFMGSGGLVFVSMIFGKKTAKTLQEKLSRAGVKAFFAEKLSKDVIEKFAKAEYDVLIGVAHSRSPLARGLDLPETVKYVVFYGVPRRELTINLNTASGDALRFLATQLLNLSLSDSEKALLLKIKAKLKPNSFVKQELLDVYRKDLLQVVTNHVDDLKLVFPNMRFDSELAVLTVTVIDSVAYMQGSGRCSRLFVQGLTKGASFLLVDDEHSFQLLQDKLSFFEVNFKEFSTINLDLLKQEILNHRLLVRKALKHELSMRKEFFKTGLMIVESPTKAKTIARFFGKPSIRRVNNVTVYEVNTGKYLLNIVASLGHVLDLSEVDGFDGVLVQDQSLTPVYSVIAKCEGCGKQFTEAFQELHACKDKKVVSKRGIINTLRLLSYESNIVLIATDPDVEGEKIAWDIQCLVKPFNENIYRVTFHEVTRKAIVKSLEELSSLDLNLVKAQIVRRVSDRWVGFELSKQVWRVFKNTNLSAGRVQTPVLGWIIQRTAQSRIKKPALLVDLNVNGSVLRVLFKDLAKNKPCSGSNLSCQITSKLVEQELKPEPPFCTETLLQAASRFGFSAQQVMSIAQDLFENGLITYHRTDSVRVSTQGVEIAKKWFSSKKLGFFHARTFEKISQGAHECIRPTKPLSVEELSLMIKTGAFKPVAKLTKQHLFVYDLIFKRFMSSQSENAKVVKQLLHFKLLQNNELVSTSEQERVVKIVRKSFLTFLKTQPLAEIPEGVYPVTSFKMLRISVVKPYSQAELIQEMKSKHLGRPSTYAKIIETLLQRGYVVFKSLQQHVKKQRSLFLISTKKGVLVYKFLTKQFPSFVSEEFTRELEKQMDSVESGTIDHEQVLIKLYQKLRLISNNDSHSRTRGDSNPGSAG